MYLNSHSFHSLRYGTIPLKELVEQAIDKQLTAMALTDINTVTGIYDFLKACEDKEIKPLVGIEFRQDNKLRYIGLAKNKEGLGEMNRFLTSHNFDGTPLPLSAPVFENVTLIYPVENVPEVLKDYEYVGIRPEQLLLLYHDKWFLLLDKMVVLQPVTFRTEEEFNLHLCSQTSFFNVACHPASYFFFFS